MQPWPIPIIGHPSMKNSEVPAKLHLGSGTTIVPGWINIDGSWNARLARYPKVRRLLGLARVIPPEIASVQWRGELVHHDVRKPLPYATTSIGAVYSSHMLEHLFRADAEAVLAEIYRVLVPGGVVRIVVPDVRAIVQRYLRRSERGAGTDDRPAADIFNEELLFRDRAPKRGSLPYRLYSAFLDFHSHKWMYDAESLSALMKQTGFREVAERKVFESRIDGIERIELPARVEDGAGVCVEGVKPGGTA